jgi:hypothetical protein
LIEDRFPNTSQAYPFWVGEYESEHFVRVGVEKGLDGLEEIKDWATIEKPAGYEDIDQRDAS